MMVSGLPGKMATLVAEAIKQSKDFSLFPIALSSERRQGNSLSLGDAELLLLPPKGLGLVESLKENKIPVVDFTTPDAVNDNAEAYVRAGLPFVMGTTGGDRQKLIETVKNSEICAVIAPNMAPGLVLTQAMFENVAQNFPGALKGWALEITESHQATKKDPSGTGKAWGELFSKLGCAVSGMESIRDPEKQSELGIKNLDGHGYHWLTLENSDGTAVIKISTAIEGRNPYVDGTLMAIKFLQEQIESGAKGKVFSMIDVLKAQSQEQG